MIEPLMQVHKCADCPIRCQAMKRPHSVFARAHRWHQTWWPGWKIYQRELQADRKMRVAQAAVAKQAGAGVDPRSLGKEQRRERPVSAPELLKSPAAA